MGFDFNQYQKDTFNAFNEDRELTREQTFLSEFGIGLAEEAGEVLGIIKHHLYRGEKLDLGKLEGELGDILWYISALAGASGLSLEQIAMSNRDKLKKRYPDGQFNAERSKQRHSIDNDNNDIEYPFKKIFILGPDGSGKTTVAKWLADNLGFRYHHGTHENFKTPLESIEFLRTIGGGVVFDRFYFPDHLIYRKAFPQPGDWSELSDWADVLKVMDNKDNLIVFLDLPDEELIERVRKRKDPEDGKWGDIFISGLRSSYLDMYDKMEARCLNAIVWLLDNRSNPKFPSAAEFIYSHMIN